SSRCALVSSSQQAMREEHLERSLLLMNSRPRAFAHVRERISFFRSQFACQFFVLVTGNVIDTGFLCGTPSLPSRTERPEIVGADPAGAPQFLPGGAVEGVNPNP